MRPVLIIIQFSKHINTLMTLTESQKRGAFATVVFHTAMLLFLLFFGIITPFPPIPEGGFLFDFGNSETGIGLEEPSAGQPDNKQITKLNSEAIPTVVSKQAHKSKTAVKEDENKRPFYQHSESQHHRRRQPQ